MNKYELLTIFSASLNDEQKDAIVDKYSKLLEKDGGKIESVNKANPWGLRKLAYPINYETDGYYVLYTYEADVAFPAELDRVFNITDGVLRSLIVAR